MRFAEQKNQNVKTRLTPRMRKRLDSRAGKFGSVSQCVRHALDDFIDAGLPAEEIEATQARSEFVNVKVSPSELAELHAAAEEIQADISELLLQAIAYWVKPKQRQKR